MKRMDILLDSQKQRNAIKRLEEENCRINALLALIIESQGGEFKFSYASVDMTLNRSAKVQIKNDSENKTITLRIKEI